MVSAGSRWWRPGRDAAAFALVEAFVALPLLLRASDRGPEIWLICATLALGATLAALSAIDLAVRRLPDVLTLPLAAAGIGLAWLIDPQLVPWRAAAALAGFLALWAVARLYLVLRGRAGLGLGDAKLLAASGAWVGLEGLPSVVLVGSVAALAALAVARWSGQVLSPHLAIPFGPFLALGFWLVWLYGPIA